MKKILFCFLLLLSLCFLCACTEKEDDSQIDIVCSVFPIYDWATEIVATSENVDLELLLKSGVDMHSYQPGVQDIAKIAESELFIYVGGASDAWVEEVLQNHRNPDRTVLRLIDYIECEDLSCASTQGHSHTHESEGYDEHIWLSLQNAACLTDVIADAIGALDTENASLYEENAKSYIAEINTLDSAYSSAFDSCEQKVLLFADRFPFVYLTRDYDLTCFAAFSGCSAESEASAATVRTLAEKVKEYDLSSVLILEDSADAIATSVIVAAQKKDVAILKADSMQSISEADLRAGVRYLSVMEKNLSVFLEALQVQ